MKQDQIFATLLVNQNNKFWDRLEFSEVIGANQPIRDVPEVFLTE